MTDTLDSPEEDREEELSSDELADELVKGFHLSPEEEAEMTEALRSRFGLEASETPEEAEPVTELEPVAEVEQEEDPPPPPAPPPFGGIPEQEIRSLLELRNYLQANPEKAQSLYSEPEPEPVAIPEWIDQEDHAQMAMWNHLQGLESQVRQTAKAQNQIAETQAVSKAQSEVQTAMGTFRTLHPELSEDDIGIVRRHAVSLDIIDGLAKHMAGPDAVLKALDMAYWDHPEYRAKAVGERTPTEVKETKAKDRKDKLSALGGSSGSAARTETKPDLSTDRAAKDGAAQWLKDRGIAT